jgi:hypothetical protein
LLPSRYPLGPNYAAAHGLLDGRGNPRGFARFYASMVNSERLAIKAMSDYLRDRGRDPGAALAAYLEGNYREIGNGD